MGASLKERFLNSQLSEKVLFECLFFAGLFVLLYLWYLPYSQVFPYGDDLRSIVGILSNSRGVGAILTTAGLRYRPVFSIIYYMYVQAFKFNMQGYFILNVIIHCFTTFFMYKKVAIITKRLILGMIIALLFAISNFGLYSIVQAEGLMELLCMLFVVIFMSALYDILHGDIKKIVQACYIAVITYALVVFTHERFIILFIPLLLALFLRRKIFLNVKKIFFFSALSVSIPLMNIFLKIFVFKSPVLVGTSNTTMELNFPVAFQHALEHLFYMFGLHNGPQYLNGITSEQVHTGINVVISLSFLAIITLLATYVYIFIRKKKECGTVNQSLSFVMICVVTICVMIASSSFTIRVEQRWVYAPYMVALFLLAYVTKINYEYFVFLKKENKPKGLPSNAIIIVAVLMYLSTTVFYSAYYRQHFKNIFLMEWHSTGKLMYEEILSPYRYLFPMMSTIVLDQQGVFLSGYGLEANRGALYAFFGADYKNIDFTAVSKLEDVDFSAIDKPLLLLYYDNIAKAIIPVVNELSQQDDFSIYQSGIIENGFYDDHWMGKTASIYLVQPTASSIRLAGHCPDNFPNNKLIVTVNGNEWAIDIIPGKNFDVSIDYENTGELVVIELVSDVVFNPAKEGISADGRDLGVYIDIIEFSHNL